MKNTLSNSLLGMLFIFSFFACSQNNDETETEVEEAEEIVPDGIYPDSAIVISTHSDWTRNHYPIRIAEFKENPLQTDDLVFLGNSITEQGGDWGARLNNSKAKNRGIAGDTTEGVLARLGEIFYFKPSQIFILIGINDLFHNDITAEDVHQNVLEIVSRINTNNPNTEIFVQTILPTTTESLISKIEQVNALLENAEPTNPFELINLYNQFVLQNGKMNMDFSTDGVHLNEAGYQIWTHTIQNQLE